MLDVEWLIGPLVKDVAASNMLRKTKYKTLLHVYVVGGCIMVAMLVAWTL